MLHAAIASGALTALALTGCAAGGGGGSTGGSTGGTGDETITVGVSWDKMIGFREGEKAYLEQAAKELGVELVFQDADSDAQRQSSQIETMISQGAKGILVIPYDLEAIKADIDAANAAGVPVVSFDQAPADVSWVAYHVGGDPYADGKAAGEAFVKIADGKPFQLVELQGALNNDNGIQRSKGLNDAVASASNIEIISQVPTDWTPEKALAGVENALQSHPDLNGIYVPTEGQLSAVFSALQAVDRLKTVDEPGHVAIVSIDGDPSGCQALKDRLINLSLATDVPTMTKNALTQLLNAIKGQPVAKPELLPGIPVTPDTIAEKAPLVWGCQS
ncbi:MAG: hypothetical protein BGO95_09185 [Micrococcales bacterium 73-13]|nr:MAG: hypothetical protein BGO95_09185 [Micrococcales bacterium 73-13]